MKQILKISVTLILGLFFIVQMAGLESEYRNARIKALDTLSPDAFDVLVASVERGQTIPNKTLSAYLRYFQEVARLSPQRADAVGMQGFCYYHLGQNDRALEAYTKAAQIAPQFYGFHYNLAVIHFKTGQYTQSADELNKMLSVDPKASLVYIISSSKIYGTILLSKAKTFGKPIEGQFEENYQKGYQLMVATQYHLQKNEAFSGEEKLTLEVF